MGQRSGARTLCDAVILSDDAGQFNIGRHALCWVHAERLVHKLDTFTDHHCVEQTRVRGLIWDFYADLKAFQLKPGSSGPHGCASASTASFCVAPASPRWTGCWRGCMPTRTNC